MWTLHQISTYLMSHINQFHSSKGGYDAIQFLKSGRLFSEAIEDSTAAASIFTPSEYALYTTDAALIDKICALIGQHERDKRAL